MKLKSILRTLKAEKKAAMFAISRLTENVEQIDAGIAALSKGKRGRPAKEGKQGKRRVSAATRKKMRASAKKRWAKRARTQPKAEASA